MLVISNVSKRYREADTFTLKDITFSVKAGEKVGLIGPNGSGKSTLMQIITGQLSADTGSVRFVPDTVRMSYLAQGLIADEAQQLRDIVFPGEGAIHAQEREVEQQATRIAAPNASVDDYDRYNTALVKLQELASQIDEAAGYRALHALGMGNVPLETPISNLSGGQKTRAVLASLATSNPQLLLLDEPTNHLDVDALIWLQNWLLSFEGGVLVISHDRYFLDSVVDKLVVLSDESPEATIYPGNYSQYMQTVRAELAKQWSQWKDQQDEIARLQADVSRTMSKACKREKATKNDFQRRRAKVVAQKAKAKEKRLERYIQSDERVEKPAPTWHLSVSFDNTRHIKDQALRLEHLSIGYPDNAPLVEDITLSIKGGEHIALIGPNGHGKSTLLKTITGELAPLRGRVMVSGSAQIGYLSQEQEVLDQYNTALETIQHLSSMDETEARSFLHLYLFSGDDPLRPIQSLSYGERTRLMLARLVAGGANVLIMDEPLNHLDIDSRERFEAALANFPGSILMVVHDRYFVEQFADTIWLIAEGHLVQEIIQAEPM